MHCTTLQSEIAYHAQIKKMQLLNKSDIKMSFSFLLHKAINVNILKTILALQQKKRVILFYSLYGSCKKNVNMFRVY